MKTPPAAVHEFAGNAARTALPQSDVRPLFWSIRREMWENRFLYIAPMIVAVVVLFGTLMSTTRLPAKLRGLDQAKQQAAIVRPYGMSPAPIMLATFLVGMFYCLDALYGERRDRSILFWKSLPVSDRTIVLSKVIIPLAVLPLIAMALAVITQFVVLLVTSAVLLGSGLSAAPLWAQARPVGGALVHFYGLTVHTLWFAPIYGWLLLVSAFAKRAPFLWALLPLLATSAIERIVFGSSYFLSMLGYRVTGAMGKAFAGGGKDGVIHLSELTPARFLSSPGLWLGLAFTAAALAAAVRLRRRREAI